MTVPKVTLWVLALLAGSTAAWSLEATSPATGKAAAARIKRVTIRCEKHPNIDACNDAIRWSPSDPALLVGLADALMRANRPADALRHYQRAAALAPDMPALAAKMSAAEKRLSSERPATVAVRRKVQPLPRPPAAPPAVRAHANLEPSASPAPATKAPENRYSNIDPETRSH